MTNKRIKFFQNQRSAKLLNKNNMDTELKEEIGEELPEQETPVAENSDNREKENPPATEVPAEDFEG